MDPLTALSLASNIVQFIGFASRLVSQLSEIYKTGSLATVLNLETIYDNLHRFDLELVNVNNSSKQPLDEHAQRVHAVQELVSVCKADCGQLLAIVRKLKIGLDKKTIWSSLLVAVKSIFRAHELSEWQERLKQTQTSLTLHICALTSDFHGTQLQRIHELRKTSETYHIQQREQLTEIKGILENIKQRVCIEKEGSPKPFPQQKSAFDAFASETAVLDDNVLGLPESVTSADHTISLQGRQIQAEDIEILEGQIKALSICTKDIESKQQIIKSLTFASRPVRHEKIPMAHQETFNWVFSEPRIGVTTVVENTVTDDTNCASADTGAMPDLKVSEDAGNTGCLLEWLRKGSGLFWVTGKPGSGKSTFMKYLADNQKTEIALSQWASPHEAVIASHYFWAAGSDMQKSQKGLLQTLVFELFRKCPRLVETAYDPTWMSPGTRHANGDTMWTQPMLHEILRRIAQTPSSPIRYCFFIDGLDEYDGDYLELCEDLRVLSRSPHIKLCLSSRPWNVFEDEFGHDKSAKLYMHQLTETDIRNYVRCRLSEHPRWSLLVARNRLATDLIQEITERSKGVFLWVFLVTRLLRSGLSNDDSYADLLKRLASFPSDLEPFFKHILECIDSFYYEKMSGALQIAVNTPRPLGLIMYAFHDQEYDDPEYASRMAQCPMFCEERRTLQSQTARRLNGYCCGLLETDTKGNVNFLHRTVGDFLKTREMTEFLRAKSPPFFNPISSILKAYLASLKTTFIAIPRCNVPGDYEETEVQQLVSEAMRCACLLSAENYFTMSSGFHLLDEIEAALCRDGSAEESRNMEYPGLSRLDSGQCFFRETAILSDLPDYLDMKLRELPDYLDDLPCPALCIYPMKCRYLSLSSSPLDVAAKTMKILLKHGQDPNEVFVNEEQGLDSEDLLEHGDLTSPWAVLMTWIIRNEQRGPPNEIMQDLEIDEQGITEQFTLCLHSGLIQSFLEHGADPDTLIFQAHAQGSHITVWESFLWSCLRQGFRKSDEQPYLDALDAFLDHKAFGSSNLELASVRSRAQSNRCGSACQMLLDRLQKSALLSDDGVLGFIAEVITRLIVKARITDLHWPADCLWERIKSVFGEARSRRMMQCCGVLSPEAEPVRSEKVRKRWCCADSGNAEKRRRV